MKNQPTVPDREARAQGKRLGRPSIPVVNSRNACDACRHWLWPALICGRVIQASAPLRLAIVDGLDVRDSRLTNVPRRYNGARSQELPVIRQNHATGGRSLERLRWGLIPSCCPDPQGGRQATNATAQ